MFFQRESAALRAISFRLSGESALALAGPPFGPPSLPRATAAGFLPVSASMRSNTRLASKIGSVVLERLGIGDVRILTKCESSKIGLDFKLTHYLSGGWVGRFHPSADGLLTLLPSRNFADLGWTLTGGKK